MVIGGYDYLVIITPLIRVNSSEQGDYHSIHSSDQRPPVWTSATQETASSIHECVDICILYIFVYMDSKQVFYRPRMNLFSEKALYLESRWWDGQKPRVTWHCWRMW